MTEKEFLKEKDLLLNSIEKNTKEHWENYYSNVPIRCIFEDLVIDINEIKRLTEENQKLKKQLEEVEFIVGLRQKRDLIHKFDKEYDEEDKKKNPNRDYAGITPDAEEVYRRYYSMKNQQKEFIEYINEKIDICDGFIDTVRSDLEEISYGGRITGKTYIANEIMKNEVAKKILEEILSKYQEIIGGKK